MSKDVVFDLGGVVFRWEPLVVLQTLFPQRVPNEGLEHRGGQVVDAIVARVFEDIERYALARS